MRRESLLGTLEEHVMLAVVHSGENAYGMHIRRQLERRLGRPVAIGAVYATLDRLEAKGYLASRLEGSEAVRRGRPRRYFMLRAAGVAALEAARAAHASMWRGVALDSKGGKA